VANYFMDSLPAVFVTESQRMDCVWAIYRGVKSAESETLERRLLSFLYDCPRDWVDEILKVFEKVTDPEAPKYFLADGTPFLSNKMVYEDDLPF
jgi:hypothetical protein